MARSIRVVAVPKKQPDVRLAVLALLALAQQLQEEADAAEKRPADSEGNRD